MSGYIISELDKQAARTQQLLTAAFNEVAPQDVIEAFSNSQDGIKADITVSVKPDSLYDKIMGIRAFAPTATMTVSEISRNEGYLKLKDILNKEGIDVEITQGRGQTTEDRMKNLALARFSRGGPIVSACLVSMFPNPFTLMASALIGCTSLGVGTANAIESKDPRVYLTLKRQGLACFPT
jgi:hypothetical protein